VIWSRFSYRFSLSILLIVDSQSDSKLPLNVPELDSLFSFDLVFAEFWKRHLFESIVFWTCFLNSFLLYFVCERFSKCLEAFGDFSEIYSSFWPCSGGISKRSLSLSPCVLEDLSLISLCVLELFLDGFFLSISFLVTLWGVWKLPSDFSEGYPLFWSCFGEIFEESLVLDDLRQLQLDLFSPQWFLSLLYFVPWQSLRHFEQSP